MDNDNPDTTNDSPLSAPEDRAVNYRWDGEAAPSFAVIEAVAATTGREPSTLPPLQKAIDGDSLDELFTGGGDGLLRLSFEYAGTAVTLYRDGSIVVLPP